MEPLSTGGIGEPDEGKVLFIQTCHLDRLASYEKYKLYHEGNRQRKVGWGREENVKLKGSGYWFPESRHSGPNSPRAG